MAHTRPIAALYDIHGNVTALEAVLREVERRGIEAILVGGDVAWGPNPRETVDLLQGLGSRARFIRGNADREVADPSTLPADMPDLFRDMTRWCAEQLTAEQVRWLGELPLTLTDDGTGLGSVFFCHGSPRGDTEAIRRDTPAAEVAAMLAGVEADVVVCGHTHQVFDRQVERWRVVNPGSVGLHYGVTGACWAIIGEDVQFQRTEYDIERAIGRARRAGVPGVEEFVAFLRDPASA